MNKKEIEKLIGIEAKILSMKVVISATWVKAKQKPTEEEIVELAEDLSNIFKRIRGLRGEKK